MTEIMETLAVLSLLVFVIGSMASMGLSLKMKQIIDPSRTSAGSAGSGGQFRFGAHRGLSDHFGCSPSKSRCALA